MSRRAALDSGAAWERPGATQEVTAMKLIMPVMLSILVIAIVIVAIFSRTEQVAQIKASIAEHMPKAVDGTTPQVPGTEEVVG